MAEKEPLLDFNALGQAIDTTWGRSSTTSGASQSVKMLIKGNSLLEVTYRAIVNMVSDRQSRDMKDLYMSESNEAINAAMKRLKTDYKDLSESNLKAKKISDADSLEFINMNIYNGKKTAYFKRIVIFEIS